MYLITAQISRTILMFWITKTVHTQNKDYYIVLEIKPCGLGSRIRDVEAFWYRTEIKIIHFVPLCLIVWFTLTLNFGV